MGILARLGNWFKSTPDRIINRAEAGVGRLNNLADAQVARYNHISERLNGRYDPATGVLTPGLNDRLHDAAARLGEGREGVIDGLKDLGGGVKELTEASGLAGAGRAMGDGVKGAGRGVANAGRTMARTAKGLTKMGLMLGAAVAAPLLLANLARGSRKNAKDAGDAKLDDVTNSLGVTAAGTDGASVLDFSAVSKPTTLMGLDPQPGEHAAQVQAGRNGLGAGLNPVPPNTERVGRSVIDGKPVESLGGAALGV